MAVAKSYENYQISGEPYDRDGKKYVIVIGNCKRCGGSGHYSMNAMGDSTCYRCGGSGKERMEVRWYTDSQRASMDKAAERRAAVKKEQNHIKFAARNAFGFFDNGYITIFKGDIHILNEWAHETYPCRARYANHLGWYVPSNKEVENLPDGITPIKLTWDEVRDENDPENLNMKDYDEVKKYIDKLLYGEKQVSKSEYQGTIGDWIIREVIVKKNIEVESRYGLSHMHIMEDNDGNVYVWNTASKNIEVNTALTMRMKVKDHKEYQDTKQTIVYYCKEK